MARFTKPEAGTRFTSLVLTGNWEYIKNKWVAECRCDCGNTTNAIIGNLRNNATTSCGCIRKKPRIVHQVQSGDIFGQLTVIGAPFKENGKLRVSCHCTCGQSKVVICNNLVNGRTVSCGCRHKGACQEAFTTHGNSETRLYRIWRHMKTRCANPNVPCWESYGGRGIKICEEWFNSFEVFQAWAIDAGYQKHLTIDRRDNNAPQGYCPENCHWVTNEEQSRNKRNNHREEFLGETKTIAEWSRDERCAVSPGTFKGRIVQGWNMKDAFTTPAFYRGIKGGTLRCRDRAALKG